MNKKLYSFIFALVLLVSVSGVIYACREVEECEENCEVSVTPTETPTATPTDKLCDVEVKGDYLFCVTETPTITPTPTVISCGEGEHVNLQGDKCLKYELGGAPESTWTQEDYDKNFPGEGKFHGLAK